MLSGLAQLLLLLWSQRHSETLDSITTRAGLFTSALTTVCIQLALLTVRLRREEPPLCFRFHSPAPSSPSSASFPSALYIGPRCVALK